MTLTELFRDWLKANRRYYADLSRRRGVTSRKRYRPSELYEVVHRQASPCFVLSTGRCGTKLLAELLDSTDELLVRHEPEPLLSYHAAYAYRHWQDRSDELRAAVDCARYELVRDAFLLNRGYVETGPRCTFFAHQIAGLYPRGRFVHLVRDPMAFVESGYSRGWYEDRDLTDESRIVPMGEKATDWAGMTQVQKIAWLWIETNRFIADFGQEMGEDRFIHVSSEDLFSSPETFQRIASFTGVASVSDSRIRRRIRRPVNAQRIKKVLAPAHREQVQEMLSTGAVDN